MLERAIYRTEPYEYMKALSTTLATRGFTILGLLLTLSIFGFMIAIIAPVYLSYLERVDFAVAQSAIREQVSRASSYAYSGKLASEWGVFVTSTSTTLYAGHSFSERVSHLDEVISFSSRYGVFGTRDISFASENSDFFTPISITMISPSLRERTILINRYGVTEISD